MLATEVLFPCPVPNCVKGELWAVEANGELDEGGERGHCDHCDGTGLLRHSVTSSEAQVGPSLPTP